MKCEKCGEEICFISTSRFSYDGSDYDDTIGIEEDEHYNAVIMETDRNWTGYELSEEEMRERITNEARLTPWGAKRVWNKRTPKERGGEK